MPLCLLKYTQTRCSIPMPTSLNLASKHRDESVTNIEHLEGRDGEAANRFTFTGSAIFLRTGFIFFGKGRAENAGEMIPMQRMPLLERKI